MSNLYKLPAPVCIPLFFFHRIQPKTIWLWPWGVGGKRTKKGKKKAEKQPVPILPSLPRALPGIAISKVRQFSTFTSFIFLTNIFQAGLESRSTSTPQINLHRPWNSLALSFTESTGSCTEENVFDIHKMQNFVKSTSSNSQLSPDSTDEGDPYYPVPNPRNQELYAKYQVSEKRKLERPTTQLFRNCKNKLQRIARSESMTPETPPET